MTLSKSELDLLRQWYNAVEDLAPKYLEAKDRKLADRILAELGIKPMAANKPHKR